MRCGQQAGVVTWSPLRASVLYVSVLLLQQLNVCASWKACGQLYVATYKCEPKALILKYTDWLTGWHTFRAAPMVRLLNKRDSKETKTDANRTKNYFSWNFQCRFQWTCGLRRSFVVARLLRLWVRIPKGAWIFVCCECCVLLGRGLCDERITPP